MADAYTPTKADKFSFGLWTVGNMGRDPFGEPVRAPIDTSVIVEKLIDSADHVVVIGSTQGTVNATGDCRQPRGSPC